MQTRAAAKKASQTVLNNSINCNTKRSSHEKPHQCPYKKCKARFARPFKLAQHLNVHTGKRPYACKAKGCNKTYTNPSHLKRHQSISHLNKQSEPIICNYKGCNLSLSSTTALKKHISRQHKQKHPFTCSKCSQGFRKRKQLQAHSYVHTGEPFFNCDDCERRFTTSYLLNKHKKAHKTYSCECKEVFKKWSHMLVHRKICSYHAKKYKCETCSKLFSQLVNYRNHLQTHQDLEARKLLECPYEDCHRVYLYKRNLKYHIESFHQKNNIARIPCTQPDCLVTLSNKQNLKRHLVWHFKWNKLKKKVTRKDRGVPKKSIASVLSGYIPNGDNDQPFSINSSDDNGKEGQLTDEEIFRRCESALARLQRAISSEQTFESC